MFSESATEQIKENLSYEMCDEMATVCKEGKIYIRWRRKGLTDYIR